MKNVSLRKVSILGLVLMAASAVTAAMLPNTSVRESADDGTLQQAAATNDGNTCKPDQFPDTVYSCNVSATASTANGNTNVGTLLTDQTAGNTSVTAGDGATSIVS